MKTVTIELLNAMAISIALNKYLNRLALKDEWSESADMLRNIVNDLDHKITAELHREV